jgi:hypothetical protein
MLRCRGDRCLLNGRGGRQCGRVSDQPWPHVLTSTSSAPAAVRRVRSLATWLSTVRPLISLRQMQRRELVLAEDPHGVGGELREQLELTGG